MAEYGIDTGQAPPAEADGNGITAAAVAQWAGAIVSLMLVAGVAIWGYRIAIRDVSGVPIVQAMQEPMRVLPDDPGGNRAENQGLAVNNVAGDGVAQGPADRVVIASRPAGLAEEDVALGLLNEFGASDPAPRPPGTPQGNPQVTIPDDSPLANLSDPGWQGLVDRLNDSAGEPARTPGRPPATGQAVIDALDDVALPEADFEPRQPSVWPGISGSARPAAPAPRAEADAPMPQPEATPTPDLSNASPAAVPVSLRPQARRPGVASGSFRTPSGEDPIMAAIRENAALTAPSLEAPAGVPEIAAEDLPSGTPLAQIGAFDSATTARAQWDRLVPRFGAYLGDKVRVIQRASSGGRVFYRLRAHGFVDIADARRFCAAFVSGGVDCIPVTKR